MSEKKIKSALLSVFYKEGLDDIVRTLHELNIKITQQEVLSNS